MMYGYNGFGSGMMSTAFGNGGVSWIFGIFHFLISILFLIITVAIITYVARKVWDAAGNDDKNKKK